MIESTNWKFGADFIWPKEPTILLEKRFRVAGSVSDYNRRRPHSSLRCRTSRESAGPWKMEETGA
ncbi:MAG: hypothetical protein JRM85_06920 [Nitrososphaerota archaeon]|nr:hypothetical protein [Nitrososphaerota archaeon]